MAANLADWTKLNFFGFRQVKPKIENTENTLDPHYRVWKTLVQLCSLLQWKLEIYDVCFGQISKGCKNTEVCHTSYGSLNKKSTAIKFLSLQEYCVWQHTLYAD